MRVFAIAQGLGKLASERAIARGSFLQLTGQPCGHGGVMGGGAGIGGQGQFLAEGQRGGATVPLHLIDQLRVIGRIGHHGDKAVVLGRRPDHCRAADVDVFDAGGVIGALGHGFFERVKVDDQKVDRLDPMGGHGQKVFVIVAQRQKAAMHIGVQGFDPTIHHFGKARHIRYIAHRQPRRAQHARGTASRDQFHPHRRKRAGKIQKARLVGHRNQRASDVNMISGDRMGHGGRTSKGDLERNRHLLTVQITNGQRSILCLGQGPAQRGLKGRGAARKDDLTRWARPEPPLLQVD